LSAPVLFADETRIVISYEQMVETTELALNFDKRK
jgi:hypothetical protein